MSRLHDRLPSQLPDGFTSIQAILDGNYGIRSMHNIIGVVTDFRAPVPTRGADWKCQFRIYDRSVEDPSQTSIAINVFRLETEMPDAGLGDVMVIFQAKLQSHQGSLSLITHKSTDIHLYSAQSIPRPPQDAFKALKPPTRRASRQPRQSEHEYVSFLYHSIDRAALPSEAKFADKKMKSSNITDKFRELKGLRDGIFADVIAQVVRDPFDIGDRFTLWISDYSENDKFFNFAFKGISGTLDHDVAPMDESGREWRGPFGKHSMQVTCYDQNASFIRDNKVSMGSWVMLRNLQIKYGQNGANLEGFLRNDQTSTDFKINICIMDVTDTDSPDPRLKEAVRRKRHYEHAQKEQLKDISEAAMAGRKRKSLMADIGQGPTGKETRKSRRSKKRAAEQAAGKQAEQIVVLDLNDQVKCEHENKAASTVEDLLKPINYHTTIDGEEIQLELPFINANYRAHVRVINFLPSKLEDFACPKRSSEYDILSDNEASDSDSASERGEVAYSEAREWEWRFYLELEDATPQGQKKKKKDTLWVAVDNSSGQCLMDLDASNLRQDKDNLESLRQRLFFLWGDLEEQRSRERKQKQRVALAAKNGRPPLHSSDDEGTEHEGRDEKVSEVKNRPFACCIRQYGVKVPESDPGRADAGNNKRWQRMFGLFGTRIA